MASRLELQTYLETIPTVKAAYYSPNENINMMYPCIVYRLNDVKTDYADDTLYNAVNQYQITVIDRDPTTQIGRAILTELLGTWMRNFNTNNLYHEVYTAYY